MQFLITLINDKGVILERFQVEHTPLTTQILAWKQASGCVRVIVDIAC